MCTKRRAKAWPNAKSKIGKGTWLGTPLVLLDRVFPANFAHLFRYNEHALVYSGLLAGLKRGFLQPQAAARVYMRAASIAGTSVG